MSDRKFLSDLGITPEYIPEPITKDAAWKIWQAIQREPIDWADYAVDEDGLVVIPEADFRKLYEAFKGFQDTQRDLIAQRDEANGQRASAKRRFLWTAIAAAVFGFVAVVWPALRAFALWLRWMD